MFGHLHDFQNPSETICLGICQPSAAKKCKKKTPGFFTEIHMFEHRKIHIFFRGP